MSIDGVSEGWPGEDPQTSESCAWPGGLVTRFTIWDVLIFLCHRFSVGL